MPTLGTPYRIFYQAKKFRSGLTDVVCRVMRPDLSVHATIPLVEVATLGFNGLYSCEVMTLASDPVGEWVARVVSATDQAIDDHRMSYDVSVAARLTAILTAIGQGAALGQVTGNIDASPEVIGIVDAVTEVVGKIALDPGTIGVTEENALATGQVDNNLEIRGEIAEDE